MNASDDDFIVHVFNHGHDGHVGPHRLLHGPQPGPGPAPLQLAPDAESARHMSSRQHLSTVAT